ncbi:MAG: DNA-3-methyladenine glycosylase 2 family protein [Defluviitaleaceae bacterium]|nr:DNA-3-methyladenine glycosylase 2 family protein [Defluviitaleaceae bacterium]
MNYFEFDNVAVDHLTDACPVLGDFIKQTGKLQRQTNPNIFETLIDSIVGQQISSVAASTVFKRLEQLAGSIEPQSIHALSQEDIQKCGMSMKKAGYIKGAALAVVMGDIYIEKFSQMSDTEIIKALCSLQGVGKWTAQMLLIFSLNRMDIISYDDLAIKRGMKFLYNLDDISRKVFETYAQKYSPYASVASLYLWQASSERTKTYVPRTYGG